MAIHVGTNSTKWRRPGETHKAEGKTQRHDAVENKLIENLELKDKVLAVADTLLPLLEGDANVGDVMKMIERSAPVAALRLMDIVVNGNRREALSASKELLYMAGYKPVEKSINVHENIERMSIKQLDGFLENALKGLNPEEKDNLVQLIEGPEGTYVEPDKES